MVYCASRQQDARYAGHMTDLLTISAYHHIPGYLDYTLPYYFCEALILAMILKRAGIRAWVIALVVVSTFPQVYFLFTTNIWSYGPDIDGHRDYMRQYVDIGGHLDYIGYLADHAYIPPPPEGWQRQQPFLYYEWCALALNLGKAIGLSDPWFTVRIASRMLYLGYVIFSILLIDRFNFSFLAKFSALGVILFWPLALMVSTRTNSDIGFMFFFMATLFHLQRWHEELSRKDIAAAIIYGGLSLACKAMGAMSLVTIAGVVLCELAAGRITYRYFVAKAFAVPSVVSALCLLVYFGRIGYYNWMHHANLEWFANVKPGEGSLPGPASPYYLVYFNLKEFIRDPFFSWGVGQSHQYTFWDLMFRTLLYGNEASMIPVAPNIGETVNILWIFILVLALWPLPGFLKNPERPKQVLVLVIACAAMIVLTMIQRCLVPDGWLSDGRRIYPLITIIAIWAALTIERQREKGNRVLYVSCSALLLGFAIASTVYTISAISILFP